MLRKWATPLTVGTFVIVGVTGVLWYFHIITSMSRWLHEIIGLAMVVIVGFHIALNWRPFTLYFKRPLAASIMGLCTVVTLASFISLSGSEAPLQGRPDIAVIGLLAQKDLGTLAPVFDTSAEELALRLEAAGFEGADAASSVASLAGQDMGSRMRALAAMSAQ